MAFLMKALESTKATIPTPECENKIFTSFVR